MISFQKQFVSVSALNGPPFIVVVEGKPKRKFRILYILLIIIWLIHTFIRYSVDDPIGMIDHLIFMVFIIPSFIIMLDDQIVISGNHGSWEIYRTKILFIFVIILSKIEVETFSIEIRIVSQATDKTSLIIMKTQEKQFRLKTLNILLRDIREEMEAMNIKILTKTRGILQK